MPLYRAELLAKKPLRYAALIHDVSQVLYLPFDWDDGSYARDRSGYNNHGTIYGATLATGKIGMSRFFDGVDDRVECGVVDTRGKLTLAAWIKATGKTGEQSIIDNRAFGPRRGFHLLISGPAYPLNLVGRIQGNDTLYYLSELAVISQDVWHHITFTFDGSWMRLYLNGTEVKSVKQGVLDASPTTVRIGDIYTTGTVYSFQGIIDEVRIYNQALSRDEIRMLMYRRLI